MRLFTSKNGIFVCLLVVVIYLGLHLFGLTQLSVFADESIYIRWAQLIIDDPRQYFFFPLNDGKTPLFIWQLIPALLSFDNPLFAARLVSVLGGLLQLGALVLLIKELKGGYVAQIVGAVLVTFLPFWFFHHHMALMDGWLAVWLTLAVAFLLRAIRLKNIWLAVISGLCVGASLLTKVPAVLAIPSLLLMSLAAADIKKQSKHIFTFSAVSVVVGLLLFAGLKLSPVFSQIFARGSDFLFSLEDVFNGIWLTTIRNTPSYINYFWQYATPPIIVLFISSFFLKKNRKRTILLALSFLAFYLPIALMGKVVFPRYLLPAMIFLTTLVALTVEELWSSKNKVVKLIGVGLVGCALVVSIRFIFPLITQPDATPFVSADRTQYLTEWSSGHGIKEVYELLEKESANQKIAVATEGYFGTLPDGLLMYLHNKNVDNVSVEGVGQPITQLPTQLIDKKDMYDRFWLVVNSHRKSLELPPETKIASYCRPYEAPCLEVWDVTDLVRKSE